MTGQSPQPAPRKRGRGLDANSLLQVRILFWSGKFKSEIIAAAYGHSPAYVHYQTGGRRYQRRWFTEDAFPARLRMDYESERIATDQDWLPALGDAVHRLLKGVGSADPTEASSVLAIIVDAALIEGAIIDLEDYPEVRRYLDARRSTREALARDLPGFSPAVLDRMTAGLVRNLNLQILPLPPTGAGR